MGPSLQSIDLMFSLYCASSIRMAHFCFYTHLCRMCRMCRIEGSLLKSINIMCSHNSASWIQVTVLSMQSTMLYESYVSYRGVFTSIYQYSKRGRNMSPPLLLFNNSFACSHRADRLIHLIHI